MLIVAKKTTFAALAFAMAFTFYAAASESRAEARSPVTREQAQQVALQRVNGGRIVESEFNNRWFRDNDYEFTVVDDTNRYDIQVDAKTGQVINISQEPVFRDNLNDTDRQRLAAGTSITPQRARSIAMERAPNALITDMEREIDGNNVIYSLDMVSDNMDMEMRIDGLTGRILSYDADRRDPDERRMRRNRQHLRNAGIRDRGLDARDAANRAVNDTRNATNRAATNVRNAAADVRNQAVAAGNNAFDNSDRAVNAAAQSAIEAGQRAVEAGQRAIEQGQRAMNRNVNAADQNINRR